MKTVRARDQTPNLPNGGLPPVHVAPFIYVDL